ncbi:hypothetical protein BDQ17DRAFT_1351039 [Cyathus striatus]|nr:hypothetical protein BDQ17DRAFT_1351039 [Cyathus striatus]
MTLPICIPSEPVKSRKIPPRIPQASYRHASPSGPWPWADLIEDMAVGSSDLRSSSPKNAEDLEENTWTKYPTIPYKNWTYRQIQRSGIGKTLAINHDQPGCNVYQIDIRENGQFSEPAVHSVTEKTKYEFWDFVLKPRTITLRTLFVENMTGSVLQMLGARFSIEPFFFSSALNWIPCRYQEDIHPNFGDHITVILTFPRTIPNTFTASPTTPASGFQGSMISRSGTVTIDTQAPLSLSSSDRLIIIDLLAVHMVRRPDSSTIISYHPSPEWHGTNARYFHSRVRYAGQSVYWKKIFERSDDPTCMLICMLWYALYAWDESLENLYMHICSLEERVLRNNDIHLTRELHIIRASLLHYASMLDDFKKAVVFVRSTRNPAMLNHPNLENSIQLLERECDNLLSEIERLEMSRKMQDMRLDNVINLAFNSVNFEDSRDMQRLTEAALRDSAVMKQISYLTMVFLPATFVATAFGMNIREISPDTVGTLAHYMAAAVPLTAITIWLIMAFHNKIHHEEQEITFWSRLKWPIFTLQRILKLRHKRRDHFMV